VEGSAYIQTDKALRFFADYHAFAHALAGARSGHSRALLDVLGKRLRFVLKPRHDGYDALTLCLAGTVLPGPMPMMEWMKWTRFPERRPGLVDEITATVHCSPTGRLAYAFDAELSRRLALLLGYPENDVPVGWEFPWGRENAVRRLVAALHIRCIYHLCAIHFAAGSRALEGGGVDDLLLLLPRGELVRDLHRLTSVPLAEVVPFVTALTFGHGTTSPDPALQPLMLLGGATLAIPCVLITSSRSTRNLLSLHARVQPRTFDAQSQKFEREMLARLEAAFRPRFPVVFINAKMPKMAGGEELDMLAVDDVSHTIFVGEARAMIMPADPNELFRRLTEMEKKVRQLRRKVESVRKHLDTVLPWSGVSARSTGDWHVAGAVIVSGSGGILSEDSSLPVVPELVVVKGVAAVRTLRGLHEWLVGQTWLPQSGRDFTVQPSHYRFDERTVECVGFGEVRPGAWLRQGLPRSLVPYCAD
jgi:hypothetical protein